MANKVCSRLWKIWPIEVWVFIRLLIDYVMSLWLSKAFLQKMNGTNMDCKMCGKAVKGEIIRAIGSVFHPDCFKCCICNKILGDKETPFTTDNHDRLYCQPCYNE